MINIDDVKATLSSLASMTLEELERYNPIINNAVSVTERLIGNEESFSDERAVYLSAAKANYDISLVEPGNDVTSFKAGDVSISQGSYNRRESAKAILDSAMRDAADIIRDNGFAFLGV